MKHLNMTIILECKFWKKKYKETKIKYHLCNFFFQFKTRESNFKKGENKSKNSFLKNKYIRITNKNRRLNVYIK